MFHTRTGSLVTLSNGNKTAQRNHPAQEFNNGVILTAETLKSNQLFEVKIDRKVNSWSGSIEIGVTTCDPTNLNFPTSATGFREGTWIMSGNTILMDGHTVVEEYGQDLDTLNEGDRVGVMRSAAGALHFFVNGVDQGGSVSNIPENVYAVIDMYGKCCQVSIVSNDSNNIVGTTIQNDIVNEAIVEASGGAGGTFSASNESLLFHEHTGTLVKLSNGRHTAERRRPMDEFNNGVVMTNRPLKDDEMFEIRLDRLVDKWSGSIEVGITTHNPASLDFPATMTNMRTTKAGGTIMMSGCGILTNGKGTRREYGDFNLDELMEGDRIGLVRKSTGALHYFINGLDQGVAANRTPHTTWGVVDLYGMAVKVTILDHVSGAEPDYRNFSRMEPLENRANNTARQFEALLEDIDDRSASSHEVEQLFFHTRCGSHAKVIGGGKSVHRPNAVDDFNNGVVLTSRILKPGEMFEVRLDKMVDKWAGSIEIGVTTHTPLELDFPSTMTNIRSGTWMMTGNGVMYNGTTIIDEYGQNLDRLKVGDRVGVLRKRDGILHFYVNGIDQGAAAISVPGSVYGVIDLYGQAAAVTIVDQADLLSMTDMELSLDSSCEDLKFHHLHGRNATINSGGKTASRPNARGEFNDAIVMSNRPLRDNELFDVSIDKMVDRWSGSIEAGVSLILPEELDFPNTMTDIDHDTWMLSGSAIMQDGSTIRNGYKLDLDTLSVGDRIGMMRCSDGTLHYFFNGVDQGVACTYIAQGVYAVIDLYGQCAQVTITTGSGVRPPENRLSVDIEHSLCSPMSAELSHRFSQCAGKNIAMKNNGCTACRVRGFNNAMVFSNDPLRSDELFEVKIEAVSSQWTGSLQIGLTSMAISDSTPMSLLPPDANQLLSKATWVITGSTVNKNGVTMKSNYASSLERLQVGDCIGIKRTSNGNMVVYINGVNLGVAATNIPRNVFALVDLYGHVEQVSITSSAFSDIFYRSRPATSESVCSVDDEQDCDTAEACCLEFHSNHGKNIELCNSNLTASRISSFNNAVLTSQKALTRNHAFTVRIDRLNDKWTSSLMIGVVGFCPDKHALPASALHIKKSSWIFQADSLFHCGTKTREGYGPDLDSLQTGDTVGILVDDDNALHLFTNGMDHGVAAMHIPAMCYPVVDLYGQCEQVTILGTTGPDCREKANMEEGMKEKAPKMQRGSDITPPVKNCEYQNMCSRFRQTLGLPEGYFQPLYNRCYCDTCHKIRGDEPYYKKGEPPTDYALPFGWCKFSLRIPAKAEMLNVFEKWHLAYHGTSVAGIRGILDTGDLLRPGDKSGLRPGTSNLHDEKNKPEEKEDGKQIFLSPTIRYAGCHAYAPKIEYKDPKTKKTYSARIAFQVCVKPGSYKICGQSIGANEQIDPKFSNNEVEWVTKEKGATVLCGVLCKLEP